MSDENKELRFTLVRLTTYGISKEDIEKALEKAGKEITKTTDDWVINMNSYNLKNEEGEYLND